MEQLTQPKTAELRALSLAARALREPLAGILNTVEQLSKDIPNASHPEIGKINRRLFQIMRMLNNMSDALSLRTLQKPPMALYNIANLFDEILSGIPELVSKSGRQFHFTGLSSAVFTLVNRELLERGVYNLISNAIMYSPENSVITATLHKKDSRIYFTIKNSTLCDLAKATFCNFTQSNGIGLGMSIVRSASSVHGGSVLILRSIPHTVQVTMTLPIRQNEPPAKEQSPLQVDYTGNWDHSLLELSDCLPSSVFEDIW